MLGATYSSNANEGLNNLIAMFVSKRIKVHKHYRMFADFAILHKDLGVLMLALIITLTYSIIRRIIYGDARRTRARE